MKNCFRFVGIVAVLFLGCALIGCAGSSKKKEQPKEEAAAEQKGSLSRTFTLTDEQGRKAGTLTVHPFGGAVLRDADGAVIKEFQPGGSSQQQPVATPAKPDPTETPTQIEPSQAQPNTEAK